MEEQDLERTDVLPRLGAAGNAEVCDDAVPLPFTPVSPSVRDREPGDAPRSAAPARSAGSAAASEALADRLDAALDDARQARDELEALRAELREQQGDSERLWLDLLRRQEEVDQLQRQLECRPSGSSTPLETPLAVSSRDGGEAIVPGPAGRTLEWDAALATAWREVEAERALKEAAVAAQTSAAAALRAMEAERDALVATVQELRDALTDKVQKLEAGERQQQSLRALLERTLRANAAAAANPPTLTDPSGPERRARLVRIDGKAESYPVLPGRTRIGRAPGCELMIDSASVSRHHAVLLKGARGIIVEDLNSTNGVVVNGRKVTRQLLTHGDVLAIGEITFRVEVLPTEGRADL